MKKTFLLLFIINCSYFISYAQKYSNNFLSIGVGARNLAMGGAVNATISDVTAGYWNPAGLVGKIPNREIMLMHAEYFQNVANYDYIALAQRLDHQSSMGVSILRLGVDDIPNTLNLIDPSGNLNYNNVSSFSAADYGVLFSYGRQSKDETLKYGANVKIIRRVVGNFATAWGFGIDIGIQKKIKTWQFGAVLKDATQTFNIWKFNTDLLADAFTQSGNVIPENSIEKTNPRLILGLGKKFELNKNFSLLAELDADITTDGKRNTLVSAKPFSIDPYLGLEASYRDKFFLRGGLNNIQKETNFDNKEITTLQPNLGVGIRIKNIVIDYALTDVGSGDQSLYSNVISLLIKFKRKL